MQPKTTKLLTDMANATDFMFAHLQGVDLDAYLANDLLRLATERQFEVVGEAARRIALSDPLVAAQITGLPRIISFRNVIAHDYEEIDHALVIEIVRSHLPVLRADLARLLGAATS